MTTPSQTAAYTPGQAAGPPAPSVPLSVLDRGGHAPRTPAEQAVQDMVETARTADASGYHRFWVAEHHASAVTASSVPAVLIAHIAARTARIRVGAGGVMLPNHPAFTVAEQFATLQSLSPGRIDLGLGRSARAVTPAQQLLEAALRRDPQAVDEFPDRIDELLGFLYHRGPDRNRFPALRLTPHTATPPEVHILGASEGSARLAAERGLPFVYGHHLSRSVCRPQAAARYRAAFDPGPDGAGPHLVVAVNVVCAATDEEAEDLALSTAVHRINGSEESTRTSPAGQTAPAATLSPVREKYLARRALEEYQVVNGGPATVAAALIRITARLGADEIMVVPYELTRAGRCRTLRLTADGSARAQSAQAQSAKAPSARARHPQAPLPQAPPAPVQHRQARPGRTVSPS